MLFNMWIKQYKKWHYQSYLIFLLHVNWAPTGNKVAYEPAQMQSENMQVVWNIQNSM